MDNNLGNVIKSSVARAWIYGAYVIAGLAVGALQVAFAAVAGVEQPDWLTIALAVYAYLGIPVGGLAAVNSNIVPTKVVAAQNVEHVESEVTNVG
jgi:hypothetical protein